MSEISESTKIKFWKSVLQNGYYWNRALKEKENYKIKDGIKAIIKKHLKKKNFEALEEFRKERDDLIIGCYKCNKTCRNWFYDREHKEDIIYCCSDKKPTTKKIVYAYTDDFLPDTDDEE